MKPSSALIIVLLPAPFGPSSPTAPAANDEVTSRRAILRPYITVTVSSVTTGAISGINTLYGFHGSRDSRGSRNPTDRVFLLSSVSSVVRLSFLGHAPKNRQPCLQRPPQPERIGPLAHEQNHIRDVLVERQAKRLGAGDEVLALHAAGEGLVFHALLHRTGFQIQHAFARPYQRGGGDEPGELVAGEQRFLEEAVARDTGDFGRVRPDRANHPIGIAPLAQDFAALVWMIAERRP